eukprot:3933120-Rhodomonas_salina.2
MLRSPNLRPGARYVADLLASLRRAEGFEQQIDESHSENGAELAQNTARVTEAMAGLDINAMFAAISSGIPPEMTPQDLFPTEMETENIYSDLPDLYVSEPESESDDEDDSWPVPTDDDEDEDQPPAEPELGKRVRKPVQREPGTVADSKAAQKRAAMLAANEYVMHSFSEKTLGYRALAVKHGVNHHMTVERCVRKLEEDPQAIANLRALGAMLRAGEMVDGETVDVQADKEAGAKEPVAMEQPDYLGSGVSREVYAKAMADAMRVVSNK